MVGVAAIPAFSRRCTPRSFGHDSFTAGVTQIRLEFLPVLKRGGVATVGETVAAMVHAISPRYLSDFRCIGPDCEDTCCGPDWGVPVDAGSRKRLKLLTDTDPKARRRLADGIIAPRKKGKFARLGKGEDGNCYFLDHDRLCWLQKGYGTPGLPSGCNDYPRQFTYYRDRLEVAATLSCPEAARRCLLGRDAMQLDQLSVGEPGVLQNREEWDFKHP